MLTVPSLVGNSAVLIMIYFVVKTALRVIRKIRLVRSAHQQKKLAAKLAAEALAAATPPRVRPEPECITRFRNMWLEVYSAAEDSGDAMPEHVAARWAHRLLSDMHCEWYTLKGLCNSRGDQRAEVIAWERNRIQEFFDSHSVIKGEVRERIIEQEEV